jgi:hypothetical protein
MAISLKDISKLIFDWALPIPPSSEGALRQSILAWRRVWARVFALSFLLGWVPLVMDPGDWRAYLNYYASALLALVANVCLTLWRPLPLRMYWHGVLAMSIYGMLTPCVTWIASVLNPQQVLKVVPKYGPALAALDVTRHLTGVQSRYHAPAIVFGLGSCNALLGFGTFAFQRIHPRKSGSQP